MYLGTYAMYNTYEFMLYMLYKGAYVCTPILSGSPQHQTTPAKNLASLFSRLRPVPVRGLRYFYF